MMSAPPFGVEQALAAAALRRSRLARALRRLRARRNAGRRSRAVAAAARALAARATVNRCMAGWRLFVRAIAMERRLEAAAAGHARAVSIGRTFHCWRVWTQGKRARRCTCACAAAVCGVCCGVVWCACVIYARCVGGRCLQEEV
jgi:hypothetical protein